MYELHGGFLFISIYSPQHINLRQGTGLGDDWCGSIWRAIGGRVQALDSQGASCNTKLISRSVFVKTVPVHMTARTAAATILSGNRNKRGWNLYGWTAFTFEILVWVLLVAASNKIY